MQNNKLTEYEKIARELASHRDWGNKAVLINKKIIEIDNNYSPAYTRLAKCYRENGKIQEALSIYKQALLIDKDNIIAKNGIEELERELLSRGKKSNNIVDDHYFVNMSMMNENGKYISHCYSCGSEITDEMVKCEKCGWYICKKCGSCGCGYDNWRY